MFILALSVLVALTIDIHIRRNVLVIDQLGTWLSNYFEPVMIGRESNPKELEGVHGWEGFLRLNAPGFMGMHESSLYSLLFWHALHTTTLLPLAAYCVSFAYRRMYGKRDEHPIDLLIYFVVVTALLVFAVMSRARCLRLLKCTRYHSFRPGNPPWAGSAIAAVMSALFLVLPVVYRRGHHITPLNSS
jgi:hypothetical protein